MLREHFQRLTALDASFLAIESEISPMHVGAVIVAERGPLGLPDGGIDIDRIRRYIHSQLGHAQRYRQKIRWVPAMRHPVWVDDDQFNIHYHVRHAALPRPGDERQLKRLAGRLFSQRLDRSRPLWEIWVVEGLDGDRIALITKAHHCMVDGIAGAELVSLLLRGTPDASMPEPPEWTPRPAPSDTEILGAELSHRATGTRALLSGLKKNLKDQARSVWGDAAQMAGALRDNFKSASPTPLNPPAIGPHRRFDFTRLDLGEIKAVKNALGGTVNDVILTVATGAIARFMERRGVDLKEIQSFRAMIPVNVRKRDHGGTLGNRVAMMIARLPIDEPDPRRRFELVHEAVEYLKNQSGQTQTTLLLEEITDATVTRLLAETVKLSSRQRPYNVVITNVPGPPFPLYLLGARLDAVYPLVPLYKNQALGIALFSYAGGMYWGLVGDWQTLPELHDFVADIETAFAELREVAGLEPAAPAPG